MNGFTFQGPADFRTALHEVRSRAADYRWLWERCAVAADVSAEFARLREQVDPERPYFIGELASGVGFAGDARDYPTALHALHPDCNATLIEGLLKALGDRSGDVIDVGANLGVVSASVANCLGSRGTVVAIEPSPSTALVTAATLALNGIENARLLQAAASDRKGELTFYAAEGNSAVASAVRHDFAYLNTWREITVTALPVDALCLDKVALIKIDVEGYERAVLRGAIETIRRCAPIVVYEFTPVVAREMGWTCEASIELVESARPYTYRGLTEPNLLVADERGRWVDFPLPADVDDQVNVFATPR